MVCAITNDSYILHDILKIKFVIYVPIHIDYSTKIGI